MLERARPDRVEVEVPLFDAAPLEVLPLEALPLDMVSLDVLPVDVLPLEVPPVLLLPLVLPPFKLLPLVLLPLVLLPLVLLLGVLLFPDMVLLPEVLPLVALVSPVLVLPLFDMPDELPFTPVVVELLPAELVRFRSTSPPAVPVVPLRCTLPLAGMQFVLVAPFAVAVFVPVPVPFAPFVVFRPVKRWSGLVAVLFPVADPFVSDDVVPFALAVVPVPEAPVVLLMPLVLPLAPLVPVVLPDTPALLVPLVEPEVPIVPLVLPMPLDDIVPLPLICIGGHGFVDVVLPAVVCCAPATAASAAVSASDRLAARHRDVP